MVDCSSSALLAPAVPFYPLIFRDLRVTGSLLGNQQDLKELVDLVGREGIEVKTKTFKLDEVPKLLGELHSPTFAGKAVVRVGEDQ